MPTSRNLMSTAALTLALSATPTLGQTIYVDTSSDVVDFGGAQQVADLPGPDGRISLPEAGLASDNTPGVQTIGFHIPQSDWQFQQFFPGRAVLRPFLGFRVFDTAIIDATTQTAFTGDTYPEGGEVVIWQETYLIDNSGGRMVGFDSSSIHISGGSNNVIQGNTNTGVEIFDSSFNLIGGVNPGEGNTGGVIQIDRASNNIVVGNTVQRLRVLGWIAGGQAAMNNRIGGPSLGERNFITGLGTLNSQGIPSGFAIQLFDSIGTLIENNQIGTTPDGMQAGHPWTTSGIYVDGENHNITIRGNRIAGILARAVPHSGPGYFIGTGISIGGTGVGVSITGNSIGLNAANQPVLGSVTGISTANYYLGPVQSISIGTGVPDGGNEIAGNLLNGITLANTSNGVRIAGNSIHDNGALGIDLINSGFLTGVTLNDPFDADTGANGLQNFPVLSAAQSAPSGFRLRGNLDSLPSQSFTLEFFLNAACDPSGYGEGHTYIGSLDVQTDANGHATFDHFLPGSGQQGTVISATAIRLATGDTSEFSTCITLQPLPCTGDFDADGDTDSDDVISFFTAWDSGDPAADADADGDTDSDDILIFFTSWDSGC